MFFVLSIGGEQYKQTKNTTKQTYKIEKKEVAVVGRSGECNCKYLK